jgi:NADH dehydrogenase [ubiquinone] 1 alpha subcomplex assembly factor 6
MTGKGDREDSNAYCADLVRSRDHDRFLTSLFAPAGRRAELLALYAFNQEVAQTAERVSEIIMGQIRLQWWREAIEGIYAGTPRRHPVVEALSRVVERHDLPRARFETIIDARERDLDPAAPADLDELERYCRDTSSELLLLGLEVLGARGSASRKAAEPIGIAWALTGVIRAIPFHGRGRRVLLPTTIMETVGVGEREILELRPREPLARACQQLAERARQHLREARADWREVEQAARPCLRHGVLADHYLAILARADYDPFDARLHRAAPGRSWRLLLAAMRGRY